MYFISAVTTLHNCVGGSVNDTTLDVAEVSLAWASPANAMQARATLSDKAHADVQDIPHITHALYLLTEDGNDLLQVAQQQMLRWKAPV